MVVVVVAELDCVTALVGIVDVVDCAFDVVVVSAADIGVVVVVVVAVTPSSSLIADMAPSRLEQGKARMQGKRQRQRQEG